MSKQSYLEKLKDPRWQRRRLEIMERDDFQCRDCARGDLTLTVHHVHYLKGKEPWDYDDGLLITVCEECHLARQKLEGRAHLALARLLFYADGINNGQGHTHPRSALGYPFKSHLVELVEALEKKSDLLDEQQRERGYASFPEDFVFGNPLLYECGQEAIRICLQNGFTHDELLAAHRKGVADGLAES